jgi:hypothetical protein
VDDVLTWLYRLYNIQPTVAEKTGRRMVLQVTTTCQDTTTTLWAREPRAMPIAMKAQAL